MNVLQTLRICRKLYEMDLSSSDALFVGSIFGGFFAAICVQCTLIWQCNRKKQASQKDIQSDLDNPDIEVGIEI